MKTFKYVARTLKGDRITGVIEADTQEEAIAELRMQHAVVVSVSEVPQRGRDFTIGGHRRIKDKTLALMCSQFSIIMGAGLPIVRTVELVAEQTPYRPVKQMLMDVASDISAGYGLADSFVNHGGSLLSSTFVETVRAGERSGSLQEVFQRLNTYYDHTSRAKSKVASAMIYPCFVVAVAIVVIGIIMVYAVPMFKSTFESLGAELPFVTKVMIGSSDFFVSNWAIILAVIVVLVITVRLVRRTDSGANLFARWALGVPLFGRINRMNAATQYAGTMSILLSAGLSVIDSVEITARVIGNRLISSEMAGMLVDLEAGKRLGVTLAKVGEFPDLVVEMTAVGEETGSLEYTLGVIAEYYDNEVSIATQRALSILEPTIIVVLAVFVVMVLFSVYIPLFTMYGAM